MNESRKYLGTLFVSCYKFAKGLQPRVTSLYDTSALVPPHLPAVLMRRYRVVRPRRDDRLYSLLHQHCSHPVAVISSISYQSMRPASFARTCLNFDIIKRILDQLHLRRRNLLQVYSERSTRAIGQYHKLCSLAAFSLPDQGALF